MEDKEARVETAPAVDRAGDAAVAREAAVKEPVLARRPQSARWCFRSSQQRQTRHPNPQGLSTWQQVRWQPRWRSQMRRRRGVRRQPQIQRKCSVQRRWRAGIAHARLLRTRWNQKWRLYPQPGISWLRWCYRRRRVDLAAATDWEVEVVPRVAAMGWVASAMEAAVERALGSVVELEAAMAVNWAVSKAVAMDMAYQAEGLEVAGADIHSVLHSHHSPFQRRNRRNRLIHRAHPRKGRLKHRKVYDPSIHWNTSIQVQAAVAYICCANSDQSAKESVCA